MRGCGLPQCEVLWWVLNLRSGPELKFRGPSHSLRDSLPTSSEECESWIRTERGKNNLPHNILQFAEHSRNLDSCMPSEIQPRGRLAGVKWLSVPVCLDLSWLKTPCLSGVHLGWGKLMRAAHTAPWRLGCWTALQFLLQSLQRAAKKRTLGFSLWKLTGWPHALRRDSTGRSGMRKTHGLCCCQGPKGRLGTQMGTDAAMTWMCNALDKLMSLQNLALCWF